VALNAMALLKGTCAMAFLAVNTLICCVPIYLLAIPRALVPVSGVKVIIAAAMTRVIDAWVGANHFMLRALALTRIDVSMRCSEPLRRDRWYVVISNHQGWADILVLQDTFLARIPPLKFFVKQQLIWIPLLGVAMWLLGFPYVRRYSREAIARDPSLRRHDQASTQRASALFKHRPTSVLNFMEGTRFTDDKHRSQQSKYRNLLLPKIGGFGYVVASLGDRVDRVLDVTIVYPGGAPSFWQFISGQCPQVRIEIDDRPAPHLELETADALSPASREALHTWVDDLWHRKDSRIDQLRTGT
jgi:1-acyl-sn-glycerol-3-phosphate acyltransferase